MPRKLKPYPSLDAAIANIKALFERATEPERKAGLVWYRRAHEFTAGLSEDTGVPLPVIAHVIAALSPNVYWDRNKTDAEAVILEFVKHGRVTVRVSTYGRNRTKAIKILETWKAGGPWFELLSGPKVTAFAANIIDPADPCNVTLDSHAINIAMGQLATQAAHVDPRETVKERYRRAYRMVAREAGLVPCQLQAIVWTVWRNQWYALHENTAKLKGETL